MRLGKGMILSGRYEILDILGEGGMAIVYRARDLKLERDVTFKVLREEYNADEEFLGRFEVEARAAARLSHPNIVNVYDVGAEDNINYIVMEYIDGVTLKELIEMRAPFENVECLGVAIQIATALSHAHKNGIIHRDIKPQNILVTKTGVVKVTDFGIARVASNKTTTTSSTTMGSVHYFSPEQARGRFVDLRSDIYSLGIVMFEMATGVLPFDGETAVSVALKHINEPLPDMEELNPDISQSLENIIMKASAKLSTKRYASTDEMLIDMKRGITNENGDFVKLGDNKADTLMFDGEGLEDGDYYVDDYDERDSGIDKSLERKITIAAISTALAIIALISSIGLKIYSGAKTEPPLYMKDLSGLTVEEAKVILDENSINIGLVSEAFSDKVEPGLIMDQVPGATTEISPGDTIGVTVSKGTDKIQVPPLVGKNIVDIYGMTDFVTGLLFVEEIRDYSDAYDINQVAEQSPAAGELVAKGSTVTLKVSRGKKAAEVTVPNLRGRSESDAKRLIIEVGLTTGHVSMSYSDDYAEGLVCAQTIPGGDTTKEGTAVGITVSMGARPEAPAEEEIPPAEEEPPEDIEQPIVKIKIVRIPAPPQAANGTVSIRVDQINENGDVVTLFAGEDMTIDDFPLEYNVAGKGKTDIQAFADGVMYVRESIDFSQEGD